MLQYVRKRHRSIVIQAEEIKIFTILKVILEGLYNLPEKDLLQCFTMCGLDAIRNEYLKDQNAQFTGYTHAITAENYAVLATANKWCECFNFPPYCELRPEDAQ